MAAELVRLTTPTTTKCKVSSVLRKSAEFAGKHMFDDNLDTCWNSDQGSPQWILIDFGRVVTPAVIEFVFQGGFVGQDCVVEIGDDALGLRRIDVLESIEDNNERQRFEINHTTATAVAERGRFLKLTFSHSTDFYGRVTLYRCEVLGT